MRGQSGVTSGSLASSGGSWAPQKWWQESRAGQSHRHGYPDIGSGLQAREFPLSLDSRGEEF